ncbi:M48 family metallopeptidase [Desulfoplanes formicivorans]|uniref:Ste24 endopeptidase n=1 Tax=Desulfoplanes formicivorans TaxID=1592317 RepID=A0A194AEN9_9BACT|nr:M48 family metallopeptidase [Desulfoplanes formicivorans]GAU08542.1 Ste24 endopeptidase [Desulfoplanes formicivorans]
MNPFLLLVLIFLTLAWVLDLVLENRNLSCLSSAIPDAFTDVLDAKAYARSQDYTRVRSRFSMVKGTFEYLLVVMFISLGGIGLLDGWVRSLGFSPLVVGLVYFGILGLASDLLSIPFDLYLTFSLEERFGFNTTTMRTFWSDRLKGYALTMVLGGVLLGVVLWLFMRTDHQAWIWCWGCTTLFMITIHYGAPRFILPLFNDFTPLKEGELRDAVTQFAERVGFRLAGIVVMDGSRRSSKSNAFFTGFGSRKQIALFDTLIERRTVRELVAILAHEVGHYKCKHIIKGLIMGIAKTGVVFWLMAQVMGARELSAAFGVEVPSVHTGLVIFALLYTPLSLVLGPVSNFFSRKHEWEADRFAALHIDDPEDLVTALKKLAADNLSNLTPHPWYVALRYSHPPVVERIRAIRRLARAGGFHEAP